MKLCVKLSPLFLCLLLSACTTLREEFYENGCIKQSRLETPKLIQGYPCRDWVQYHPNGKLRQLELSKNAQLRDTVWAERSVLTLDSRGRLQKAVPSENMTFGDISVLGGSEIQFYGTGELSQCYLQWDTLIQGVPCKGDPFSAVHFFHSGSLRSAIVSEDYRVDGRLYREGNRVSLQKNGLPSRSRNRREQRLLFE